MQRLGLVTGLSTPSASAKKAYEALYDAGPSASIVEALEALFLDVGKESRQEAQAVFLGCVLLSSSWLSTIYVISKICICLYARLV